MSLFGKIRITMLASAALAGGAAIAAASAAEFQKNIKPILENYCFDCHADGANKGNVAFDEFKNDQAVLANHELWLHVLKNLRAGLMPPKKKSQPTLAEKELIESWIKNAVFAIDPKNPDPGRVTIRRLNRVEYRNTIRDLIGVQFDTQSAFPADDTGHGFDNIGDVLTLSPMLLEKYVVAANQIVSQVVPAASKVIREEIVDGADFGGAENARPRPRRDRPEFPEPMALSYYKPAAVSNTFKVKIAGRYQLGVALMINEKYVDNVVDLNKCRLTFRVDGKELLRKEYAWEGGRSLHYNYEVDWQAGDHELTFELQPLTPDEPQTRSLSMQITSVKVSGPMAQEHWVQPRNYTKFFPKPVPADVEGRRAYARESLGGFARRAFRRPADEQTLDRLVSLAESIYSQPGKTFEAGISQGMVAVLASPRFLFREERAEQSPGGAAYPYVDEFSLASRLSYFLWSSMPDEELLRLAEAGKLRRNLTAQVERLLKHEKSEAFVRNFVGQWLRARDIENIPIEARIVLAREEKFDAVASINRKRLNELREKPEEQQTPAEREEIDRLRNSLRRSTRQPLRAELTGELRLAMRLETEKSFDYVLREDRSLLELLDSDYTFLNGPLAKHYGIEDVTGKEMRLVKLPANSPRGGILTQGTVLGVTSNPTRTSPVKRGVFILDNILGTPPPPPPPNIPPLEDATKNITNRAPTLRESLAAHREQPLCSSCHNRMDPLGLAFENFNAMGMWRDAEFNEPIDATGSLITGETFHDVRELKRTLVKNHYKDYYHTVTEKLLTYALGRGLEYYDVETCDQIVARIEAAQGRPSALIAGVVGIGAVPENAPGESKRTKEISPARAATGGRQNQAMNTKSISSVERAAQQRAALTRRHFLRGLGACIALPAFESLSPLKLLASSSAPAANLATTATGAPLRSLFLYSPNGAIQPMWWPKGDGANFELSRTLQPLESVRQHVQVLGGLDHVNATAGPDGAGDHARANGTFLTGVRMKKSATNIRAGTSIDQVIAREVGHLTRLSSLELTCDAGRNTGACDSGYSCAYQYNVSWSSPTTPMTPEANPRQVFERLFGAGSIDERATELKRRRAEQRSILDFITQDARDLQRQLNPNDKDKLDQYLTGVRELEGRIQRSEKMGDPRNPAQETPPGIPPTYAEHIQLMFDTLVLAFQTDSTRVATMLLAHDGSNRSFAEIGIPEGHHDLSHHRNNQEWIQKLSDIDLWYAKQFGRFLERLRDTKDVDGNSLLHNSMILYGSGNADGNQHTHVNLPIVLAGGGGGSLTPGRFVKHGAQPTSNLFLSMADRMGVRGLERFGDSSGRLANV